MAPGYLGSDKEKDSGIEGTALVVTYTNPSLLDRSIIVLEGGLTGAAAQTTRLHLGNPIDKTIPNFIAQLGLGISFSYQPNGDHSTIDVNSQRLTSSAGNFDDGLGFNGALITVGGVGDVPYCPPSKLVFRSKPLTPISRLTSASSW